MILISHLGRGVLASRVMMIIRSIALAVVFQLAPSLQGAEIRMWTSTSGTTIEAKLKKIDGEKAILITPKAKTIPVKIKDLSLADRAHLVEFAEADPKIITEVELGIPEKKSKIKRDSIKKHEKLMGFGEITDLAFNVTESEHFLVASTGRFRAKPLIETAEALWHGMAFQHMNFRQDWGDKKKIIIVTTDENVYAQLGEWYVKWIKENMVDKEKAETTAGKIAAIWGQVSGTSISIPEEQQERYQAFPRAKIIRVRDGQERNYKKVFSPFPTHLLAEMLISDQMGGISEISPVGYFTLTTGHAFFKEIQLAGRSVTKLIDADEYDDEISSSGGFESGKSWAKSLRKLVKKGKITPDLEKLLSVKSASELNPEQLVLMYSLAYYMQSNSSRIASYAKMVQRIESNNQVPAVIEMARIFGFESVEDFQEDWSKFIKSTSFK